MRLGNKVKYYALVTLGCSSLVFCWPARSQNLGYFCEDPYAVSPSRPLASDCKSGWQRIPTTPPVGRQGSDPSSCPTWTIDRQSRVPLKPITCVTIYPLTPSAAARAVPGQAPREAFSITNADPIVQRFVESVNAMIGRYDTDWRPSDAEISEHRRQGYSGGLLLHNLKVPETGLDGDKQVIDSTFLSYAGQAIQFIDTTTEEAKTSAAIQAGEHGYYLVALATLHDNGSLREMPGFSPLMHVRPPQARQGCEAQAALAAKGHLLTSTNPYVTVRYECWTEAKYTNAMNALMQCKQYGVGCDRPPF
jgi:hypothetical protein